LDAAGLTECSQKINEEFTGDVFPYPVPAHARASKPISRSNVHAIQAVRSGGFIPAADSGIDGIGARQS
jgi:hypothetical protein